MMLQLIVTATKLNKRRFVPANLPDAGSINGTVTKGFTFLGEEVKTVPNPALGRWYKDRDNNYYWGGGVTVLTYVEDENEEEKSAPDNSLMETSLITPIVKKKIEQVVNAFETGSATGNYGELVKYRDYTDPETNTLMVQITFGRSQTTEFGHLKALIQDYVNDKGNYANELQPYLNRIGKKPSLATDNDFCTALKNAGKNDPIMKSCQDQLFEMKYYQPAHNWFTKNEFTLPLSLLVIYDSTIHSGSVPAFLRKRFPTVVPASGGNEKEWIQNYVDVREKWLANHSNTLLHATVYRTQCFKKQIENDNWNLVLEVKANGVNIS
jgi:chitosanase